jgi:DNA-binding LacI/PurR family transcriptional regulator
MTLRYKTNEPGGGLIPDERRSLILQILDSSGRVRVRDLALRFNTTSVTIRNDLNELQKRGLLLRSHGGAAKSGADLFPRGETKATAFLLCNRATLHSFHSRIFAGAEAYCAVQGWEMIFLTYSYSQYVPWKELHLPKVLLCHDVVRAVILAGTNSPNLIEVLDHQAMPFAVLGNNVLDAPQNLKHDVVFSDDIQGGYEVTRYLISQGHRHICFVGNTRLPWFSRCSEGYRRAMDEAGLVPRQSDIHSEDDSIIGYLGTKSLLAGNEPITAIFAGSDPAAHGVYKALREGGLRIPDDISVVGCNDTVGEWLYPGLTTIREFPEEIGKYLAEAVLNRIATPGRDAQCVTIPTELIKRDSCRSIVSS